MRKLTLLIVTSALALAACGRAEPGELAQESPRPSRAEPSTSVAPAPPGAPDTPPSGAAAERPGAPVAPGAPVEASPPAAAPPAPTAAAAEQARAGSAEEILRRVEQTYAATRSMQADFVQHLTVPLLGSTQRSEGTIYQRRPDRFLMRFTDPAGDVLVADGRHFWMYYPSVDPSQVLRTSVGEGQTDLQQEFLANPMQRYVPTLAGSETVDGRATHLLSLVPRGQSQYRLVRVWVDQADFMVRRFELTEENESVRRIELRNLRRNVDLPDALFQFTPPPGTQVFDQ